MEELESLLSKHQDFTIQIEWLIKTLLEQNGIKYHLIESRTKSKESVIEKLERKNIDDPQNDLTDLTGIRIILFYEEDIKKVKDIIESNFKIDIENSENKIDNFKNSEFGYTSTHCIISVDHENIKNIVLEPYLKLKAEIQIRTILQHAWANVSHELFYKNSDAPKDIQRKLFRLAGLFELADEQFQIIKSESQSIYNQYKSELSTSTTEDVLLDSLSLKAEFDSTDSQLINLVNPNFSIGFNLADKKYYDSEIDSILYICNIINITNIQELIDYIESNKGNLNTVLKTIYRKSGDYGWTASFSFFINVGLIINLDTEFHMEYLHNHLWSTSIWEDLMKAISTL